MMLADAGIETLVANRRVRALAEEVREAEDSGGLVEWLDSCAERSELFLVCRDLDGAYRGIRVEADDEPLTYLDTVRGCVVCETGGREVRLALDPVLLRAVDRAAEYMLG